MKKINASLVLLIALLSPELRASSSSENDHSIGGHSSHTAPLKKIEQVITQTYVMNYTSLAHINPSHPLRNTHTIPAADTIRVDRTSRDDGAQAAQQVSDSPFNEGIQSPRHAQESQSAQLLFAQYTLEMTSVVSSEETARKDLSTDICRGATIAALVYLIIIFTRPPAIKTGLERIEKVSN